MATQVQMRRGTSAQLSSFTGAPGELAVNTDTWAIVVMDGITPGGHPAASSGGGTGTVTSVGLSGGTTGITVTGSPVTTSGIFTLGGTLAVTNGGTGASSASTARAALGAATTLQTVGLSALIEIPTAKTYTLVINSSFPWTINSISAKTSSGTCSIQLQINNVDIGSLLPITSTISTSTISTGAVAATQSISVRVSLPSTPTDLSITISGQRTLV